MDRFQGEKSARDALLAALAKTNARAHEREQWLLRLACDPTTAKPADVARLIARVVFLETVLDAIDGDVRPARKSIELAEEKENVRSE